MVYKDVHCQFILSPEIPSAVVTPAAAATLVDLAVEVKVEAVLECLGALFASEGPLIRVASGVLLHL